MTVESYEEGCVAERNNYRELVLFYRVRAVREADERHTVVHRRFRDFFALNDAVRAAYSGSHLLGSFPAPPSRGIPFFDDQSTPAFRERRRWLLHEFIHKLEAIPRMRLNSDFQSFLGLVDGVRETSVFFPPGPLGITLSRGEHGWTEVAALKPNADGTPSPAMVNGLVAIGDKVRPAALQFTQRATP